MQASPWFLELVSRAPRWNRAVWLGGLLVLSLSVGWILATSFERSLPDRREESGRALVHLRQTIEMARLSAGANAGCPEALAAATLGGVLEQSFDGWDRPVEIRCYGDTLVLRSVGADPADPFDDVVLVQPMAALTSHEVSVSEGLR
jgi:hypothetical protein